ncbi:hypothetical protein C8Q79DRAFT_147084 [Trametes meyenii]|nr:hypothetical protein C8Q79DRAFT_147084 [Trametes meyenii]
MRDDWNASRGGEEGAKGGTRTITGAGRGRRRGERINRGGSMAALWQRLRRGEGSGGRERLRWGRELKIERESGDGEGANAVGSRRGLWAPERGGGRERRRTEARVWVATDGVRTRGDAVRGAVCKQGLEAGLGSVTWAGRREDGPKSQSWDRIGGRRLGVGHERERCRARRYGQAWQRQGRGGGGRVGRGLCMAGEEDGRAEDVRETTEPTPP